MNLIKTIIAWGVAIGFLSGCNKQLEDFVNSGSKNPNDPSLISTPNPGTKALKISPGSVMFSGSQLRGTAVITPTGVTVKGSQLQAKLSLSQNRKN